MTDILDANLESDWRDRVMKKFKAGSNKATSKRTRLAKTIRESSSQESAMGRRSHRAAAEFEVTSAEAGEKQIPHRHSQKARLGLGPAEPSGTQKARMTPRLAEVSAAEALSFLKETKGVVSWRTGDLAAALNINTKEAEQGLAGLGLHGDLRAG